MTADTPVYTVIANGATVPTEPEDALQQHLDHFKTAFVNHFNDAFAPFYEHHINFKLGSYDKHKHGEEHVRQIHPFVDLRETETEFFVEVEMPGLEDKESINIQWTTPRTLLIEAVITRPSLDMDEKTQTTNKVEKSDKGEKTTEEKWLKVVSAERRIGKMCRTLYFPAEVENKALQVKLNAGLLRIKVPKKATEFNGWKVQVE